MSVVDASAQTDTIRYVNIKTGKYANDGKTWATAKDNVQDAINDLYNYMQTQNVLSTSFKIYDGIHVYGGFNADHPEKTPDDRVLSTTPAWRDGQSGLANDEQSKGTEQTITMGELEKIEKTAGDTVMRYDFKNATIFSGNHNTVMGTFKWNDNKKQYDNPLPRQLVPCGVVCHQWLRQGRRGQQHPLCRLPRLWRQPRRLYHPGR